jgi:hypothetical protein
LYKQIDASAKEKGNYDIEYWEEKKIKYFAGTLRVPPVFGAAWYGYSP